jgi:hypothetical protein
MADRHSAREGASVVVLHFEINEFAGKPNEDIKIKRELYKAVECDPVWEQKSSYPWAQPPCHKDVRESGSIAPPS